MEYVRANRYAMNGERTDEEAIAIDEIRPKYWPCKHVDRTVR